ncbi:hypothetical protein PTW35_06840 [Photobacterium sp. DA100]|uniref:hypothetical protein n=1 Tax=Photobacterium sp. DA100 TaxID=3027472 RepID=UPI00247B1610|nr:hypothetical protein [Photobacterium sp. DA100]WEM43502.1 hypothetical protein PTW35_06840 [Photobacterium sp. DA100]
MFDIIKKAQESMKINDFYRKFYSTLTLMAFLTATIFILLTVFFNFFNLSEETLKNLHSIGTYVYSFFVFVLFIVWSTAIVIDKISKYKIHEIAGFIGIGLSLLCLAAMPFSPFFTYAFISASFLCLYSSIIPIINSTLPKFSNKNWEPAFLFSVILSIFLYFANVIGSAVINAIFAIDASYFPKTIVFAMLLLGALLSLIVSFICIVYIFIRILMKNDDKNKKPGFDFFHSTMFMAAFSLFIFSDAIINNPIGFIEKVATNYDFNSYHFCKFDDEVKGVITLDPAHTTVLTYRTKDEKNLYKIEKCILGDNTDNKEMVTNNSEQKHPDSKSSSSTDS